MPLLIFDFDGVVADTEMHANALGAEAISALGLTMDADEHLARYMGKSWPDYFAALSTDLGRPLPDGYSDARRAELVATEDRLPAVPGVAAFIARFQDVPRCVASSNDLPYLHRMLRRLELADAFGDRVFSASQVARGKPWPDLFLLAAATCDGTPDETLVIEDSPAGVRAGVAAGMTVLGLCAGSHCRADHGERLLAVGATATVSDYEAAARYVEGWLTRSPERA